MNNGDWPTMIAAITVIAAVALFIIKEYYVEPKNLKKSIRQNYVQKRLEAYGTLLMILNITKARSNSEQMKNNTYTHSFIKEDKINILNLIATKGYLFSDTISDACLNEFIRKDTFFAMNTDDNILFEFTALPQNVKKEYDDLKSEYNNL